MTTTTESALEIVPMYRIARDADGGFRNQDLARALAWLLRWHHWDDEDSPRGYRVARRLADGDTVAAFDLDELHAYLDEMAAHYVGWADRPDTPPVFVIPFRERDAEAQADIAAVRELLPARTKERANG